MNLETILHNYAHNTAHSDYLRFSRLRDALIDLFDSLPKQEDIDEAAETSYADGYAQGEADKRDATRDTIEDLETQISDLQDEIRELQIQAESETN